MYFCAQYIYMTANFGFTLSRKCNFFCLKPQISLITLIYNDLKNTNCRKLTQKTIGQL